MHSPLSPDCDGCREPCPGCRQGYFSATHEKHAVGPSPSKPHCIHALLICWNHISWHHFEIVGYRDQPGARYLLQFFHNSAPGATH